MMHSKDIPEYENSFSLIFIHTFTFDCELQVVQDILQVVQDFLQVVGRYCNILLGEGFYHEITP